MGKSSGFTLWATHAVNEQRPPDLRFDNRFFGLPMRTKENMMSKISIHFLVAVSCFWGLGAMSQEKTSPSEQVQFSAEDENVKHPISVPQDAWSILEKDNNVLEVLASQGLQADQLPASWFAASQIHLDGPNERDFVVIGKGMLQGANLTTFWIFAERPKGLKLVLTLPAHDLSINSARTNGYRNIQAVMMTAGRVSTAALRFDGREYRVREDATKRVR
jgi:hypothetical protein